MKFSEKLKMFRMQKGYTQAELSKLIGTDRSNISRYENGETSPDIYKAVKIATLMGTTCEELVRSDLHKEI